MHALFTTVPSHGHLHPLVPLARALRERGHSVAVATAAEFAGVVEGLGVPPVAAGLGEPAMAAAMGRRPPLPPGERGPTMFAEEAAPAIVRDLLALDRPVDLIVHEEGEWGGPVVAAVRGVPSVAVGWGSPVWAPEELRLIDALVQPLWAAHGVTPRSPAGLFDHLYLDTCPPALQDEGLPRTGTVEPMRPEPAEAGAPNRTDARAADGPQAYVTLGTVPTFNREPELLAMVVDVLASESLGVLVTVGPNNDPGGLPRRPGVRVERYVRQADALAGSVLAVTHGGAGSTLGALSLGLPVLLLPRGAPSQRRMAQACARAGVGIAVGPGRVDRHDVRTAVRRLLQSRSYRDRAQAVRDEIARLPSPADLVGRLERLARPGAGDR